MDAAINDNLAGQTLLHYQVAERLGAGGMGVVYRAVDLKLRRTVALKFLSGSQAVSPEAKERFMREAMASSALDDANIGTVYAIEETQDGRLFLAMACYDGPTLSERMARGPIPAQEAVGIALQLLRGLNAAHRRGIVHRDIKPGNLIFNAQGVLKILDFGLAKLHGSADLTAPGTTLGTVAYMAPEQALGETADHRADLWSAGVVLYEMLAGRRLFRASELRSMLYAVVSGEPETLPGLPPELNTVLKRALQKDPDRRYQSAAEMIRDLDPSQARSFVAGAEDATVTHLSIPSVGRLSERPGSDVGARPASEPGIPTGTPARSWLRWRWAIVATAAAMLVAVASGFYLLSRRTVAGQSSMRIAVLPFATETDAPADRASSEALAAGLRSQVTHSLQQLESANSGLLVIPLSELAAQHVTDAGSARRVLGLSRVLSGSFTQSSGRVRVVLSLVDTGASNALKVEVLNGGGDDLPGLEKQMVDRSAAMLGLKTANVTASGSLSDLAPGQAKTYLASLGQLERWDKPGNLDTAIEGLTQVTKASPKFAPGFAALANCYLWRFQATKDVKALKLAEQSVSAGTQAGGQSPEMALVLGRIRIAQGEYPGAVSAFQQALVADPRSDGAYAGLARAYAAMGLPDKAIEAWRNAIAVHPDSMDAYSQLARFELTRGEYAKAAADFRKALQLAPDNAAILSNLGAALLYAGALDVSRQALQNSIRQAPSYAAWTNLGNLDLKQGRFADAAADNEKALEFNKTDYRVWSNMGAAYARVPGQKDKARDAFLHAAGMCREALKTNPNDALVLSDLAMFVASEGDERQEPLELIERALALAPEDTYVQFNAVETYESLGYRKNALDWLGKLMAAGYPLDDIKESPVLADLTKDSRYLALVQARGQKTTASR